MDRNLLRKNIFASLFIGMPAYEIQFFAERKSAVKQCHIWKLYELRKLEARYSYLPKIKIKIKINARANEHFCNETTS